MLLTGMQLGHFRLKDLIGRSANDVYLADDVRLPGREVAIKIAQSDLASFSTDGDLKQAVNQFKKEAQIVGNLRHPNILPLFEYGEEIHQATVFTYLVMPYIKDGTLERWVRQRTGSFRNMLPLQEVGAIIRVAADALQCAHNQNVIHRDVKPSNFLIDNKTSDLSNPHLLLADFGIAKISGIDLTTRAIGTFAYMAPEQWEGHPTKAGDQYSLAIIAYQLLTGQLPFTGNTLELWRQHSKEEPFPPSRLKPALSAAIDTVILRALAKKPADRYPTITQFAEALQAAILQPPPPLNIPLTIKVSEAKTGLTTTVAIPGGQPLPVYIPPNAQHGQIIRLDGKGTLHNDGSRGAVIVTLTVIPDLDKTKDKVRVLHNIRTSPSKFKKMLLTSLALLIIVAAAIPLYFTWSSQTQAAATATVKATTLAYAPTATHIAQIHAIATATAHAATATAGVIRTATAGHPGYDDPLNNVNNPDTKSAAWDGLDGSDTFCSFQPDGYHILASSPTTQPQPCLESTQNYQNGVITVDMVIKSNVASGGLLFHVQNDMKSSSYFFEVSPSKGQYKISLFDCDNCKSLGGWTPSPSIHRGQNKNTLQVIINNNVFKFYMNGIFLTEIPDSTYTTGSLGLACYDRIDHVGEAIFSNLKVYPSA